MKTIAALVLLGSMAAVAAAEDLAAGTRVRVTGKGTIGSFTGSLVEMDSSRLVVRLRDGGTLRMPLTDLRRLEVSRGPSRKLKCGLLGATIGGLVGFVAGTQANEPDGWYSDSETGLMLSVPAAVVGTLVGVVVGDEKWRRVEDSRVEVGVVPSRRGGLALAVRF